MGSKANDWRQKPFGIEQYTGSNVMRLEFKMQKNMEESWERLH